MGKIAWNQLSPNQIPAPAQQQDEGGFDVKKLLSSLLSPITSTNPFKEAQKMGEAASTHPLAEGLSKFIAQQIYPEDFTTEPEKIPKKTKDRAARGKLIARAAESALEPYRGFAKLFGADIPKGNLIDGDTEFTKGKVKVKVPGVKEIEVPKPTAEGVASVAGTAAGYLPFYMAGQKAFESVPGVQPGLEAVKAIPGVGGLLANAAEFAGGEPLATILTGGTKGPDSTLAERTTQIPSDAAQSGGLGAALSMFPVVGAGVKAVTGAGEKAAIEAATKALEKGTAKDIVETAQKLGFKSTGSFEGDFASAKALLESKTGKPIVQEAVSVPAVVEATERQTQRAELTKVIDETAQELSKKPAVEALSPEKARETQVTYDFFQKAIQSGDIEGAEKLIPIMAKDYGMDEKVLRKEISSVKQAQTPPAPEQPPQTPPPEPPTPAEVPLSETERRMTDEILTAQKSRPETIVQAVRQRGEEVGNSVANFLSYERAIKDFPQLRNDIRKFKDVGIKSYEDADEIIQGVIGPIEKDKAKYDMFRKIVVLEDLVETGGKGMTLPRDADPAVLKRVLDELKAQAPEDVLVAIDRHHTVISTIGQDLVTRGKMKETDLTGVYYPHRVLDYTEKFDYAPWLPTKIKNPYRYYTQKRLGSVRDIDTDYTSVMREHIAKIGIDNSIDDFMEKTANNYDEFPKLQLKYDKEKLKEVLKNETGKVSPGGLYEIDGKKYVGYQYVPGNVIYQGNTINENMWEQAVEQGLDFEEATKRGLVLGGKRPTYLLPEEVADRLREYRTPRHSNQFITELRNYTNLWKGVTLRLAGVPFQMNNLTGDLLNLYRDDPKAIGQLKNSMAILAQADNPEQLTKLVGKTGLTGEDILKLAKDESVVGRQTLFSGEYNPDALPKPKGINPVEWYDWLSGTRENTVRLSKFVQDLERIKAGQLPVIKVAEDLQGVRSLTPIEQAGVASRTFTVDYGEINGSFEGARVMFPFLTFYAKNAQNWARYVKRNPTDAAVKFGVPLAAMYTWNNTGDRSALERNLPDYIRYTPHVIAGKSDTGDTVVVSFQTPVDMAAQIFGLERLPDMVRKVTTGELTAQDAAVEQLGHSVTGIPRTGQRLLNPFVKIIYELAQNRDSFSGKTIVPDNLVGTPYGTQAMISHAAKQLVAPYGQYVRAGESIDPGTTTPLGVALSALNQTWGLEALQKGFGVREVDPGKEIVGRSFEASKESRAQVNSILKGVEDIYLESIKRDDPAYFTERFSKIAQRIGKDNIPVTAEMIGNRIQSERVNREILKLLLKKEVDPAKRQVLISELNKDLVKSVYDQTPKSQRSTMLQKAFPGGVEDLGVLFPGYSASEPVAPGRIGKVDWGSLPQQ